MHRVTADSNIYISALLFGGKSLALLEMAQERQIELVVSDDLLTEALGVLRDKFKGTPAQLEQDKASIGAVTRHVVPAERLDAVPSDPDDNRALECAVAAGSETIVTGDGDLLRLGSFRGMKISTVSDFPRRVPGERSINRDEAHGTDCCTPVLEEDVANGKAVPKTVAPAQQHLGHSVRIGLWSIVESEAAFTNPTRSVRLQNKAACRDC